MESPDTSQQDTKSENLGDLIAETFDDMESEEESNEEMEVSEEVSEEESEEASGEEERAEVEEQVVEEELQEEIAEAAESDYQEPAPDRWPEDIKEVYNGLPPNARKAMLEGIYKPMQRQYTQSTQELAEMRQQINPVLEAMKQYSTDFERTGVNPVEAFQSQLAWAAHIQRVGAEKGLADMRDAYGVGQPQQDGQEQYLTPTERGLKQQLDALQNQFQGQQRQAQNQNEEQRINAQKAEIENTLQNFVNEKTEDGKPKHPYVDKVASNIAGIIRGGLIAKADEYGQPVPLRNQIAQAYSMACNLDPSIRTPSVDTRQANRVKAAQKVSVVTKHPASQSDGDELDIGSFIERTYDQLAGR